MKTNYNRLIVFAAAILASSSVLATGTIIGKSEAGLCTLTWASPNCTGFSNCNSSAGVGISSGPPYSASACFAAAVSEATSEMHNCATGFPQCNSSGTYQVTYVTTSTANGKTVATGTPTTCKGTFAGQKLSACQ